MRLLLAGLAASLVAGCLGPTPAPPASGALEDPSDEGLTLSKLYFEAPPSMRLEPPTDAMPRSFPLAARSAGQAGETWEHRFHSNATLTHATASVWIRVPRPFILASSVGLSIDRPNAAYRLGGDFWTPLAPLVQPGDYKLDFSFDTYETMEDKTFRPGDVLRVHLYTNTHGLSTEASPFYVLLGSSAPSHIDLEGAAEPPS